LPVENTLEAFAYALSHGADMIELDVRACGTGELVVFHDQSLERTTEGVDTRKVAHVPLRELQHLRVHSHSHSHFITVPTLREVLEWARTRIPVNVELKHGQPNRTEFADKACRDVRGSGTDVLFSSFDPHLLAAVRTSWPSSRRAQLTFPYDDPWFFRPDDWAIHVTCAQATRDFVAEARTRNVRVGVWTVNTRGEAEELWGRGVDYVISDDVAALHPR
jgi:glycerophosphoryl diester phosphodiesterase